MPSNPTSSGRGGNSTRSGSNSPLNGLLDGLLGDETREPPNFTDNEYEDKTIILDLTDPLTVPRIPSGHVAGS
jgi:hypothetical protein